jgi:dihydroorotate dehydrogenase electron transfer subunit
MTAELYLVDVPVLENRLVSPRSKSYKIISFSQKNIASAFIPGQFVTIDCGRYLRRPFSVAGVEGNRIKIIYKIAGAGTRRLASMKKGQRLNVLGPLGNGFTLPHRGGETIAVAGGTGIAPLAALAQAVSVPGTLFYGARTKNESLPVGRFIKMGWRVYVATEDGSLGKRDTAVGLLKKYIGRRSFPPVGGWESSHFAQEASAKCGSPPAKQGSAGAKLSKLSLFAAGPKPMLAAVAEVCAKNKLKCQVAVEKIIACGVGACRGCVVRVRPPRRPGTATSGYENKTVCKDGPVFNAEDILWR